MLQCFLRVIDRTSHETINCDVSSRVSILLMFVKLYSDSDVYNRIMDNHTFIAFPFSSQPLSLPDQRQQAFRNALFDALDTFQVGNKGGPSS